VHVAMLTQQLLVDRFCCFVVATEDDLIDAAGREGFADCGDRDGGGAVGWETVDAGADGREGDGLHVVVAGELHAAAVAACELGVLGVFGGFAAAFDAPDGPYGVEDPFGAKVEAWCGDGFSGGTGGERLGGGEELGFACGAVDGAVDASAAFELLVGGVDDGVDVQRGDVAAMDFDPWHLAAISCWVGCG
jgi:hypothetical protein